MEKDLKIMNRLWELSTMDQAPTVDEEKEFDALKDEMESRLRKSLSLEKKTQRLVRYLKAA